MIFAHSALRSKKDEDWGNTSFWAPEVIDYKGKFYLVYSAKGKTISGEGLQICLAIADRASGPFEELHAPLFDYNFSCIDGHIFIDQGKPVLYYEMVGSVGEHWKQKGFLWGAIFGVELSEDLSTPIQEPVLCLYPSQEWEGLNSMKARSNEGMTVFKEGETYYMTYSGNHYADKNYGVGYTTSENPLGMWTKAEENPILKMNKELGISGPGHNCVLQIPGREERIIFHHTHADPGNPSAQRVLNMDRLIFDDFSKLKVLGPTSAPQSIPR